MVENRIVNVYMEQTAQPNHMKFVANIMLYGQNSVEFLDAESVGDRSELAKQLFEMEGVRSVLIENNYVKVGKSKDFEWIELKSQIREFVQTFLRDGKDPINLESVEAYNLANIVCKVLPTPNPENIKFVFDNLNLYENGSIDFPNNESVKGQSPLADELFTMSEIRNVFIANNFVTIGKSNDADWDDLAPKIKVFLEKYLTDQKDVLNLTTIQAIAAEGKTEGDEDEMVLKIKDLLQKYVQPAVEMDGGAIVFKEYNDGVVTLGMQGACSGCPSSTITLKAGIEGMMKRMIPEVKEVIAEAM